MLMCNCETESSKVSSAGLLSGATIQIRQKEWGWRAFAVMDGQNIMGDATTPALALCDLAVRLDNWQRSFDSDNTQLNVTDEGS